MQTVNVIMRAGALLARPVYFPQQPTIYDIYPAGSSEVRDEVATNRKQNDHTVEVEAGCTGPRPWQGNLENQTQQLEFTLRNISKCTNNVK